MNTKIKTLFKHKGRIAIIASTIIYFVLTYTTDIQEKQFEQELQKLDLNKDGVYSDTEVTKEQKETIEKLQKDSTGIAPFTLIPFAAFCGLFIFFGLRVIENNTTKKTG
jgi:hypothetical protein